MYILYVYINVLQDIQFWLRYINHLTLYNVIIKTHDSIFLHLNKEIVLV